jgi:hypothetical protein
MIDITLAKAKYRRHGKIERRPWDPPIVTHTEKGEPCQRCLVPTKTWQAGSFKAPSRGSAISNGPIQVKKYRKRSNKIRCRRKVYLGALAR